MFEGAPADRASKRSLGTFGQFKRLPQTSDQCSLGRFGTLVGSSASRIQEEWREKDAWTAVSITAGCTAIEARKEMEFLMASFRRERQKPQMQTSVAGAEEIHNSKWFTYKSLLFLMDKYRGRGTDDTMNTSESTSTTNLDDTLEHSSAPNSQNASTVSTESTLETSHQYKHREREWWRIQEFKQQCRSCHHVRKERRATQILRADEGEVSWVWSSAGMQWRGKRDIPEKTRRPATSSGTIPAHKNPGVTPSGSEPGSPRRDASELQTFPPTKEVTSFSPSPVFFPPASPQGDFSRASACLCQVVTSKKESRATPRYKPTTLRSTHPSPELTKRPENKITKITRKSLDSLFEIKRDRGGVVVRLLASHPGETVSTPSGVTPGFSNVWDRTGRRHFSADFLGGLPFPSPLHSGDCPRYSHFLLISYQCLDIKSPPKSLYSTEIKLRQNTSQQL
ncbi:hypothetical protein PR048_017014 [Dryococelus australis]|uniref:Uncharacterized protein n=1 Tax=Dryococelus australis TaxID=614101 RepID=A0ABQ9H8E5_9NEOP|nr:hypothetical protein PR048_017014 [Dryococelus australis]